MLFHESEQTLVSVCIPTYNAERTVASTLKSVLNQTYQNLEIIIVDNASTDNTLDIVEHFTDSRIIVYKNNVNIGAEKNFSKCIELATGDYIAIFHSDDLYKPEMVQKQVQTFKENPSVGAVFTLANRINEQGEVIGKYKLPVELKDYKAYCFSEIITSILKNGNSFLLSPSAMVRSEYYKDLAPFNVEKFGTSADLDMWLRILEKCSIIILDEKLMSYRISKKQGGFLYNYRRTDEADYFKVIDYHLSTKSCAINNIPNSSLKNYEFNRYADNVTRAVNYINKGQVQNAKKLLKKTLSIDVFKAALNQVEKPKYLAFLPFGVMLLVLTYIGLGQYICWMFVRLRYE